MSTTATATSPAETARTLIPVADDVKNYRNDSGDYATTSFKAGRITVERSVFDHTATGRDDLAVNNAAKVYTLHSDAPTVAARAIRPEDGWANFVVVELGETTESGTDAVVAHLSVDQAVALRDQLTAAIRKAKR